MVLNTGNIVLENYITLFACCSGESQCGNPNIEYMGHVFASWFLVFFNVQIKLQNIFMLMEGSSSCFGCSAAEEKD